MDPGTQISRRAGVAAVPCFEARAEALPGPDLRNRLIVRN